MPRLTQAIVLLLFLGVVSGCDTPEPADPPPPEANAIPIPSDVPEQYTPPRKGEAQLAVIDGRKFYIGGYLYGWEECYQRYKSGKLDLNDETAEPRLEDDCPLFSRARKDGFKACRQLLRQKTMS
jgi:hypothetical protein